MIPLNDRQKISVGQEVTIKNTQGYSWRKEKISNLDNLLQEGRLLVFRIAPFNSVAEILGEFEGIDANKCALSRECSLYLGYWNSYGDSQANFIQQLNSREYSKILSGMIRNEITVLANGLGSLDSLDQFVQLAEGKLI
ncbi:MAG: hypothetical protein HY784_00600 [Chloroflexi bacterium]|nr:hypothetical protein [Chloroflexota bacterium]